MARFAVTPGQLVNGSSTIAGGGGTDATLPSASLSGAAEATPVAGAWTAFLEDAIGASVGLDEASIELASALRAAATNYATTESRTTGSYGAR